MRKKRLTFFTLGEDVFLRDIIINLRKEYDIKFFQRGHPKEFKQLLHDTDIAWFEWCDDLIVSATKSSKMCKYICRLHSYEMFTDMPKKVDWNKVDNLVFVNDIVRDFSVKKFKINPDITSIIYNGINSDRFVIPKDKKYNKKVAYIGFINYKKGPELLLQTFKKIWDYDNEFEFYIAGDHQDERIHLYFNSFFSKLPFKIHMEGWVKDVSKFLEDKDYIISTSLFESFQYSLAEGMAQGCIPLVHSWLGSNIFYPTEFIWDYPEDCIEIIKEFEGKENKQDVREYVRKHIVDNFSFEKQIKKIRRILENI